MKILTRSLYQRFYSALPVRRERDAEVLYLLSDAERNDIFRLQRKAVLLAAFTGAAGVVLLYLPQYLMPHLFPDTTLAIFGKTFRVPLLFSLYGAVLALLEVVFLTFQNVYFIHYTAAATGFLHRQNKQEAMVQDTLLRIANSKTTKAEARFGINPFLGLSRRSVFMIQLLQKAKGALSNALVKALAGRLGGRFALQIVQNLLGIPIYAFWDAWATRSVLRRARAVIMGQNLIDHLFAQLPPAEATTPELKALIFDSLQYVAVSKRYYRDNHNLLTERLFERYGLDAALTTGDEHRFLDRLKAAPVAVRSVCAGVMLTGCLLDERLSLREELHIMRLHRAGIIRYDFNAVGRRTGALWKGCRWRISYSTIAESCVNHAVS